MKNKAKALMGLKNLMGENLNPENTLKIEFKNNSIGIEVNRVK